MRIFCIIQVFIVFTSCSSKNECIKEVIRVDHSWLDSIRKSSDTSYIRKYRNMDFVSTEYFVNKKDNIICQVMKDSMDIVRQIIIAKKDLRVFAGEYFPNGQLKAKLPLDSSGKYHGAGKYYFESGCIKSQGSFIHGLYAGKWKTYNRNGNLISVEEYDANGQLVKSIPQ